MLASRPVSDARDLIARLAARDPAAWPAFLEEYASLLLQVSREVERDPDAAGDAFLFICERLAADHGRRLLQFDPSVGGASFSTWLRVVAWNLALDARRQRHGRFRPLAAIRRLPMLQQRIYRLRYEEGLTFEQMFAVIQPEFPALSRTAVEGAEADVDRAISSRQHFVLATRRPKLESLDARGDAPGMGTDPADLSADPETLAIQRDEFQRLVHVLADLPAPDRLLVQLRFEQGVTLARIATLLGLKDPWTAARRIERVLKVLRAALAAKSSGRSV